MRQSRQKSRRNQTFVGRAGTRTGGAKLSWGGAEKEQEWQAFAGAAKEQKKAGKGHM